MMTYLKNPPFDWSIVGRRMRFGLTLVPCEQGLRPLLKTLKNRYACYCMPDEYSATDRSVFGPFFGVPTATITMAGRTAAMTGATTEYVKYALA